MSEPQGSTSSSRLRYAVDETPSVGLTLGLSLQVATVILTGIILIPIIVLNAAGYPEGLEWAVFAALVVSGLATILQARPAGPIGAGYALYMGTSGAFIGVSAAAVAAGGLSLLATLVAASSLVQFFFSARLSLFRRLITPTVGGTVIMLIAVNLFPITTNMLAEVPPGVDPASLSRPLVALTAFVTIVLVSLYAPGAARLWAPLFGIVAGTAVAAPTGMLSWTSVLDAAWFGLPQSGWPGLDLSFDARFLGLLVPFVIVTIIGAIETYGHAIAIQRVSHRTAAPVDFKVVQRALNADGVGNLLSGLAATVPNSTYSASISIADLTGVAARRVALWGGVIIVLTAFMPKLPALLQVVPGPVAGAYVFIFMVLLFRQGVRLVTAGGFGYERGLIVCISFWVGLGFQFGVIFPDHLPEWSRGTLDNGMAAGGIVAMVLTLLVSLKQRAQHDVLEPGVRSLPKLRAALDRAAERAGWDELAVGSSSRPSLPAGRRRPSPSTCSRRSEPSIAIINAARARVPMLLLALGRRGHRGQQPREQDAPRHRFLSRRLSPGLGGHGPPGDPSAVVPARIRGPLSPARCLARPAPHWLGSGLSRPVRARPPAS